MFIILGEGSLCLTMISGTWPLKISVLGTASQAATQSDKYGGGICFT